MRFELNEICGYLRDVLSFRNYIEIPDNRNSYFVISEEELSTGVLKRSEDREKLLKAWCKKGDGEELSAEVILIPKVVSDMIPKYESPKTLNRNQIWEYKRVSLLYVKAKIDRETFQLNNIRGESVVWADPLIKRYENKLLSLLRRLISVIFRKEERNENARFCLKDKSPIICGDECWRQYIGEVDRHFKKRTGNGLFNSYSLTDDRGINHNLYEEDGMGQVIVMKDDTVFAARHIVSLLSGIEQMSDMRHTLFKNLILGGVERQILNKHWVGEKVESHLGQMKNDFPLADAQRDVVHCFSYLEPGEVLAVSGPPGTGKTTMLQGIVADMVAKSVVQRDKYVPLILAASSNNKAITNIIDAFDSGENDISIIDLHHRWLCYEIDRRERFVPMAVYCPSASVDKKRLKEYFVTDSRGGLNYGALRDRYYSDSSDFYFRARIALNLEMKTLEEIMGVLVSRINSINGELKEIGNMIMNPEVSSRFIHDTAVRLALRYNRKFEMPKSDILKDVSDNRRMCAAYVDKLLDMTLRFDLYWLSVHYNECKWIGTIEKYRERNTGIADIYGKFLWDEVRYICPCVVSTFYMAPKLFEFNSRKYGKTYNYGLADLLIVDEAGQVSPEIGLPAFALAKKALVVGDRQQIPPVYNIPSRTEKEYWDNRVASKNKRIDHELLSCCQSSVMAIAENRSAYGRESGDGETVPKNGGSGLFLNEHRRCVDEIISYSNELVYKGELDPKRGSHSKLSRLPDLPPFGFIQVDGECKMKDGSRFNIEEIRIISKWLRQNASMIENAYGDGEVRRSIQQLVSIITPFRAQSIMIKRDKFLKGFPCGTVHTFQGAESPIVVFSLVYGKTDNPTFIMNNHQLMNVAVSRAKDHFLVFGNIECLKNNLSDFACKLLVQKSEMVR